MSAETSRVSYDRNVFINCPLDEAYADLLDAIVFTIHDCGYQARCSVEDSDSARIRIDKIMDIIKECRYGVHDISRTELDEENALPRFNMPLELGVFLGATRYGGRRQKEKSCLILDIERYRFQKYCSDIAGQDIKSHSNDINKVIRCVRDWLRGTPTGVSLLMPGHMRISKRYSSFLSELPDLCSELGLDSEDLLYNDFTSLVGSWLR